MDAFWGCLCSLRAHLALNGVIWVQRGSVEIAVGQTDRVLQNRRCHVLPPSGIAPLGSSGRSPLRLQLGEFGFVLFTAAQAGGLMTPELSVLAGILIALSMLAAPFLMRLAPNCKPANKSS
jgi:hypothetical protein